MRKVQHIQTLKTVFSMLRMVLSLTSEHLFQTFVLYLLVE